MEVKLPFKLHCQFVGRLINFLSEHLILFPSFTQTETHTQTLTFKYIEIHIDILYSYFLLYYFMSFSNETQEEWTKNTVIRVSLESLNSSSPARRLLSRCHFFFNEINQYRNSVIPIIWKAKLLLELDGNHPSNSLLFSFFCYFDPFI